MRQFNCKGRAKERERDKEERRSLKGKDWMGSFPRAVKSSLCARELTTPLNGFRLTPEWRDGSISWKLSFIRETDWGHVNFGFRKEQKLDQDLRKGIHITTQIVFIRSCSGTHPGGAGWVCTNRTLHTQRSSRAGEQGAIYSRRP